MVQLNVLANHCPGKVLIFALVRQVITVNCPRSSSPLPNINALTSSSLSDYCREKSKSNSVRLCRSSRNGQYQVFRRFQLAGPTDARL